MTKQSNVTTNLSAGKTPPKMLGRFDHPLYLNGAEKLKNVIPNPAGGVIRRPGTKELVDYASSSRMIEVQDQENNGFLMIFEPNANLKIIQNGVEVDDLPHSISGGAIPLHEMDYQQVRDFIFLAHKSFFPKIVIKQHTDSYTATGGQTDFAFTRPFLDTADLQAYVNDVAVTSAITTYEEIDGFFSGAKVVLAVAASANDTVEIKRRWDIATMPTNDGPWEAENIDPTRKVFISGLTIDTSTDEYKGVGLITASGRKTGNTAAKSWFNDEWAGRQMRVWSRASTTAGDPEQYATLDLLTVGTSQDTFNIEVVDEFPLLSQGAGNKTKRWALSAWYNGFYPDTVGVHQDSIYFASGDQRWKSVSGSLFQFSPSLQDDNGVYSVTPDSAITAFSNDPVSSSPSFLYSDKILYAATNESMTVLQGANTFGAITPDNISIARQNNVGAAKIKPVSINQLFYVDFLRQNLHTTQYNNDTGAWAADKVNKFDDELFYSKIRRIVKLTQPFTMIWCIMENGEIINLTVNDIDNIYAPSTLELKTGEVIDIAVLKQSDGAEKVYILDQNGVVYELGNFYTKGNVELSDFDSFDGRKKITFLETAWISDYFHRYTTEADLELMTDKATVYANGATIDLSTLDSDEIVVEFDSYKNHKKTASSKTITLANGGEKGVPYADDVNVRMNLIAQVVNNQTDLGTKRKLIKAHFALHKTLNFKVRCVNNPGSPEYPWKEVKMRGPDTDFAEVPPPFTGIKPFDKIKSNRDNFVQIEFKQDESVPFNLNSVIYEYDM